MICLGGNTLHQYLIRILVSETSDSNLTALKQQLKNTLQIIRVRLFNLYFFFVFLCLDWH